jgi:hypothetical protein
VIDPEDFDRAFLYEAGGSPRVVTDCVLTAGEIRVSLDAAPEQRNFEQGWQ